MKFNKYLWNLFKSSPEGQKAIERFSKSRDFVQDLFLIERYCPKYIDNDPSRQYFAMLIEDIWAYKVSCYEEEEITIEDAERIYKEIVDTGLVIEDGIFIKPNDYAKMLDMIPIIALELNSWCKDIFFPYLFMGRFYELKKIADYLEIELPDVPKKSDYKARCYYYWDLCEVLGQFCDENDLTMAELCALLYEYAPNLIEQEEKGEIPPPAQAWFIGGLIRGYGEYWTTGFWQANIDTKKGDILIHYETSPVSAITCLWIAQVDGVLDPFAKYYSNTYISGRIEIPYITLKELREDPYFCKHSLVRKKFQGVNGWTVTSEDYEELKRILRTKGFDTDKLPELYAPRISKDIQIDVERDVETKLLEPLLNTMGYIEGHDFIRQLPIHAGRGHRIFPDYALHYNDKPDEETARVLIEAKEYMRNNQEIEAAFLQARSYAMILDSSVIVLCDKECLIVYKKTHCFDRDRYKKFYWGEMENPDKYNELKDILR